jgi:hypothetical protein
MQTNGKSEREIMYTTEIDRRYTQLAEQECCLSCGGAAGLSHPKEGEICIDLGCGKGTDLIRLREAIGDMSTVSISLRECWRRPGKPSTNSDMKTSHFSALNLSN